MSSLPKVRRSLWEGSGRQREDTNVLGGSLDLLPQELGRRTLEPGSCFLEQAWDAALKDFGRLLPGSRNLCLSEPLVPESIGNPRLISWVNHTCYLHRPGPRALTFGGIFGRKPTDRNSTADVRYVGGWFSFWQK